MHSSSPRWPKVRNCAARLGHDTAKWAWGRLHHGYFQHAASPLLPGNLSTSWDVGPLPVGGSGSTPMHAGYRITDFRCISGASVRLIMDVGDWDNSVCINAPGQSGDPGSPHYGDLALLWARGEYAPCFTAGRASRRQRWRVFDLSHRLRDRHPSTCFDEVCG